MGYLGRTVNKNPFILFFAAIVAGYPVKGNNNWRVGQEPGFPLPGNPLHQAIPDLLLHKLNHGKGRKDPVAITFTGRDMELIGIPITIITNFPGQGEGCDNLRPIFFR